MGGVPDTTSNTKKKKIHSGLFLVHSLITLSELCRSGVEPHDKSSSAECEWLYVSLTGPAHKHLPHLLPYADCIYETEQLLNPSVNDGMITISLVCKWLSWRVAHTDLNLHAEELCE